MLGRLTLDDARAAYAAIREAGAGGLDEPVEHDVRDAPTVALREAMAAAAGRDAVASEYATGFAITFDIGLPALRRALADGLGPRAGDRRGVPRAARGGPRHADRPQARRRRGASACRRGAAEVLAAGGVRDAAGRAALEAFDAALRATATRSTRGRPPTS